MKSNPEMQPVKTIKLHVTQEHIKQARAIRRISVKGDYIPVIGVCPLALAAREHFGRNVSASSIWVAVQEDNTSEAKPFALFHIDDNGRNLVHKFDTWGKVESTTVTLTRDF